MTDRNHNTMMNHVRPTVTVQNPPSCTKTDRTQPGSYGWTIWDDFPPFADDGMLVPPEPVDHGRNQRPHYQQEPPRRRHHNHSYKGDRH